MIHARKPGPIDLTDVRRVLDEVNTLVESLDGQDLDETNALTSQSRGPARRQRAEQSQDLQFLASRLDLAAQLVRREYWVARGKSDPLDETRF